MQRRKFTREFKLEAKRQIRNRGATASKRVSLRRPPEPTQYTSEQFQRLMTKRGAVCSMSRSGNVWENAAMEGFFSSLKTDRIDRKTDRTRDDTKAHVFGYIERFHNPKHRHATIGYLSPMEFERRAEFA
jgi:putative transposase